MNVRDPFGLHRNPAIGILRATATQAALEFRERAIEAGAQALEKGKEVRQVVESAVETALETAATAAAAATSSSDDMAFAVPRNVPSFTDPQRQAEDHFWAAATAPRRTGANNNNNSTGTKGIIGAAGDLLDAATGGRNRQSLPMYKDKPYGYPASQRARPLYRRKRVLALLLLALLSILYYRGWFEKHRERVPLRGWTWSSKDDKSRVRVDWLSRRERVVEAFELSWDAYERYAWGMYKHRTREDMYTEKERKNLTRDL